MTNASKTSSKKPAAKKVSKKPFNGRGYAGHRDGSKKAKVHAYFDKNGSAKALVYGLKTVGIRKSRLNRWFGEFAKVAGKVGAKSGKAIAASASA